MFDTFNHCWATNQLGAASPPVPPQVNLFATPGTVPAPQASLFGGHGSPLCQFGGPSSAPHSCEDHCGLCQFRESLSPRRPGGHLGDGAGRQLSLHCIHGQVELRVYTRASLHHRALAIVHNAGDFQHAHHRHIETLFSQYGSRTLDILADRYQCEGARTDSESEAERERGRVRQREREAERYRYSEAERPRYSEAERGRGTGTVRQR